MKKHLVVTITLMFIGLSFVPSIHANINKEMVEFSTEICGFNSGKQTVKLTQDEADDVDALFKSIRERLNATESREESEEIFKEAVVELDKYGLLGGLNVKHVLRLTTGSIPNLRLAKLMDKLEDRFGDLFIGNVLCLVAGMTYPSEVWSFPAIFWFILRNLLKNTTFEDEALKYLIFSFISRILSIIRFFSIGPFLLGSITIGGGLESYGYEYNFPSEGWIWTQGLLGRKTWNESLYGLISKCSYPFIFHDLFDYFGIIGFTGIRIFNNLTECGIYSTFYLGSALWVRIGNEPPNFPWYI